jgi:hypothetical protein
MLHMFLMATHVFQVISSVLQVFQTIRRMFAKLFQTYVASVSSGFCKNSSGVAHVVIGFTCYNRYCSCWGTTRVTVWAPEDDRHIMSNPACARETKQARQSGREAMWGPHGGA